MKFTDKTIRWHSWRRFRWSVVAAVLFYMAVGFVADATPKNEIFPCFNWFLFCKTPAYQRVTHEIRLLRYGGKEFFPPLKMTEIRPSQLRGSSYAFANVVRKWGKLYAKGDAERAEALRRQLEASHLGPEEADYLLIEERYETLARGLNGNTEEREIARFHKEKMP